MELEKKRKKEKRQPKPASADALMKAVGRRIAELRTALRMTQFEFAQLRELGLRYVQRVEAGRENLTLEKLAELADDLGVSPAAFFEQPQTSAPGRGRPRKRA